MPALKIRAGLRKLGGCSTVLSCRSDQKAAYSVRASPDGDSSQQLQERFRVAEILEDLVSSTAAKRRHVSGSGGDGDCARACRDRTSDIEWGITHHENSSGINKFRTVTPRALDRDWYQ